ncbi:Uncharacterised protein [Corynebacterium striatum]|nr:Uncharacterised protein [Corynebacterium striatum]
MAITKETTSDPQGSAGPARMRKLSQPVTVGSISFSTALNT